MMLIVLDKDGNNDTELELYQHFMTLREVFGEVREIKLEMVVLSETSSYLEDRYNRLERIDFLLNKADQMGKPFNIFETTRV